MPNETPRATRRHQRISLPKGMSVAWYGGGQQQVSRVKSLSMGGLSLCGSITLRAGSDLTLVFELPGGIVTAQAVFRDVGGREGIGVQLTKIEAVSQALPEE